MFIYTKLKWDMNTGEMLEREGFEYSGPVAELKKGSDAAKQAAEGSQAVATSAQDLSKTQGATQQAAGATADPFAKSLIPSKPGTLSPYSKAEYQSAVGNINQNLGDTRRQAAKAAALRGFNASPGMTASMFNTASRDADAQKSQAYRGALANTLGEGLNGMNYFTQKQQIYDPNKPLQTATGAFGTEANAAQVMNSSPTLAGDIGGGLMGLAQGAGSLATGLGGLGWKPLAG